MLYTQSVKETKYTLKLLASIIYVGTYVYSLFLTNLHIEHSTLNSASFQNTARLECEINYDRDFDYDYFGFKTLQRSYLLKIGGKVAERPQHMLMRVSVGIHKDDIESAIKTYHMMFQRWFTHASPTLFNSGTPRPQVRLLSKKIVFIVQY